MADHAELVAEMPLLEKAGTQERLKRARERRLEQLQKWSQREKKYNSKADKTKINTHHKKKNNEYKVHFVPSVMLLEAAARNDIAEVRRLLMLGVSPDSTNEDGLTALHQCCIDDSEEMMKLLIEFGANVNAKDSEQWTPLHAAATCGHLHLVKYLINKGADLLAVNADGNMPYDICEDDATLDYIESEMAKKGITQEMIDETRAATEMQMLADLKRFREMGCDLEYRDHQGATPLHIAAANGYVSVVEFLLDNHVSTDVCDNDLWQPIHAAACWGHPEVMEMLVQAGADLSARTKNGEAPFDICEDPELKEKILQLKNEMETKKQTQPQKLRRSHSQNTRSQSVRRTSIREKGKISRVEMMEEARMRHEKQEQDKSDEDDELKLQQDAKKCEKNSLSPPIDPNDVDIALSEMATKDTLQRIKGKTTGREGVELSELYHSSAIHAGKLEKNAADNKDLDAEAESAAVRNGSGDVRLYEAGDDSQALVAGYDASVVHSNSIGGSAGPQSDTNPSAIHSLTRTQGESVKVEIHVTVNTGPPYGPSPGTLAAVKKQRMRNRNSVSSTSSQQDISGDKGVSQNGYHISATCTYDRPPSPTISLKRFTSDPAEVVGGEHSKHGCCNVM